MNYAEYLQEIATMAVVPQTDTNFLTIVPQMLNYAELRIQRDLDFLSSQSSTTASVTAGNNTISLPLGSTSVTVYNNLSSTTFSPTSFITLQTIEVLDGSGNSTPLLPVSKEYIQNVYGSGSTQGLPQYFAVYGHDTLADALTGQSIILGPTPDSSSYTLRLTGTVRSQSLYTQTTGTFISTYLPDLLIMASMIFVSGYQRNFGRINDDPAMAQTYESQYQSLLKSAMVEENRKKFQSAAWTPYSPAPFASATR